VNDRFWNYKATVERWIDGDTVEVTVDLGFYTYRRERLRLIGSTLGMDTPELSSKDPALAERARAAHLQSVYVAPSGSKVTIVTSRPTTGDSRDGFGRFLAQVITQHNINVGDMLLTLGLAEPYKR